MAMVGWLLLCAALVEFVLVRIVLRMGPVLPEGGGTTAALEWSGRVGLWSLNVAAVAGLAMLALVIRTLARERRFSNAPLVAAAALALVIEVVRLGGPYLTDAARSPTFLMAASAASLVTIALVWASGLLAGRGKLLLTVLCLAYGVVFYRYAVSAGAAFGAPAFGGSQLLVVAEALVLLVPPVLLWTLRPRWDLVAGLAATGAGVLYAAWALVSPWTVSAVAIWDFGFTSFLPAYVYGSALWLTVYGIVVLMRRGQAAGQAGLGLALLALGGLRLDYSHFSVLVVTGILLIATALQSDRPAPAHNIQKGQSSPSPVVVG